MQLWMEWAVTLWALSHHMHADLFYNQAGQMYVSLSFKGKGMGYFLMLTNLISNHTMVFNNKRVMLKWFINSTSGLNLTRKKESWVVWLHLDKNFVLMNSDLQLTFWLGWHDNSGALAFSWVQECPLQFVEEFLPQVGKLKYVKNGKNEGWTK